MARDRVLVTADDEHRLGEFGDGVLEPVAEHRSELGHVLAHAPQVVGHEDRVHPGALDEAVPPEVERLREQSTATSGDDRTDEHDRRDGVRVPTRCLDDDLRPHGLSDEHEVAGPTGPHGTDDEVPELRHREAPAGCREPAEPRQVDADGPVRRGECPLRPREGPVRHADAVHEDDRRGEDVVHPAGRCQGVQAHGESVDPDGLDSGAHGARLRGPCCAQ